MRFQNAFRCSFFAGWRQTAAGLAWVAAMLVAGCGEDATIREYQVAPIAVESSAARTLGAIVPRGSQAWFFKLTGDPDRLEPRVEEFTELVKSVKFAGDGGQPAWDLPAGWQQQPGSEMRFATLTHGAGNDQLEISVMALPLPEDDVDGYVLSNVNRWRGQVKLDEITQDQLSDQTEQLEVDGQTAYLVDITGKTTSSGSGMSMRPPFAGGAGGEMPAGHPPVGPATSGSGSGAAMPAGHPPITPGAGGVGRSPATNPLEYQVPEGWEELPGQGIRVASFRVAEGEQALEVTIIPLGPGANSVLQNVNIWRGQIGLPSASESDLAEWTTPVEVAGQQATLVHLVGADDAQPQEAILAVLADRKDSVWFFKAKGPAELVVREKPRFLEFIQSVTFKSQP